MLRPASFNLCTPVTPVRVIKNVNYKQDSCSTINCYAEQEQPLGSSSFFVSLNRGRFSVAALIDFCPSFDTTSCQLTGKANIDEVVVGYITSGAGQFYISTVVENGVMFF